MKCKTKKNLSRVLTLVLCFAMLTGLMPGTVFAIGEGESSAYKVEYYKQSAADVNEYNRDDSLTESKTGAAGDVVTANPIAINGYTYKDGHTDEVKTGKILADGSLVLKLYYDVDGAQNDNQTDRADGVRNTSERSDLGATGGNETKAEEPPKSDSEGTSASEAATTGDAAVTTVKDAAAYASVPVPEELPTACYRDEEGRELLPPGKLEPDQVSPAWLWRSHDVRESSENRFPLKGPVIDGYELIRIESGCLYSQSGSTFSYIAKSNFCLFDLWWDDCEGHWIFGHGTVLGDMVEMSDVLLDRAPTITYVYAPIQNQNKRDSLWNRPQNTAHRFDRDFADLGDGKNTGQFDKELPCIVLPGAEPRPGCCRARGQESKNSPPPSSFSLSALGYSKMTF